MFEDRRVPISITLKKELVQRLDDRAKRRGVTRSRLVEDIVTEWLE